MHVVVSGRLMGWGELWIVPTEPHFVEVAQVVLAHLEGLEDSVALHVVQRCTQQIRTPCFFTRLCMVTGHHVPFIPLFETLADLFVLQGTKVCICVASKDMTVYLDSSSESLLSSLGRVVLGSTSTVSLLGWAFFTSTSDLEELLSLSLPDCSASWQDTSTILPLESPCCESPSSGTPSLPQPSPSLPEPAPLLPEPSPSPSESPSAWDSVSALLLLSKPEAWSDSFWVTCE